MMLSRKATCLNRSFSPAWLALGHSFAQESEHDQATSAYFTSAQIMKGFVFEFIIKKIFDYKLKNNCVFKEFSAFSLHRTRIHVEQQSQAGRAVLSASVECGMRRSLCFAWARRNLVQIAKVIWPNFIYLNSFYEKQISLKVTLMLK